MRRRKTYLPGIRATFAMRREINNFENAIASNDVKLVLGGCEKVYLEMHPVVDKVKIAFGMDLALCSKEVMKKLGTFKEDPRIKAEAHVCSHVRGNLFHVTQE
jgi:hypothetical protein